MMNVCTSNVWMNIYMTYILEVHVYMHIPNVCNCMHVLNVYMYMYIHAYIRCTYIICAYNICMNIHINTYTCKRLIHAHNYMHLVYACIHVLPIYASIYVDLNTA